MALAPEHVEYMKALLYATLERGASFPTADAFGDAWIRKLRFTYPNDLESGWEAFIAGPHNERN